MSIISVENEDLGKIFWHLPEIVETKLSSLSGTLQQNYITIASVLLERYGVLLAGLYANIPESTELVSVVVEKIIALEKETFEGLQKL